MTIVDAEELAGAMTEQLASLFEEETGSAEIGYRPCRIGLSEPSWRRCWRLLLP